MSSGRSRWCSISCRRAASRIGVSGSTTCSRRIPATPWWWVRPGRRRRPWRSRRCSNRPTPSCAPRRAAARAASPTMSMRSAWCCFAWRWAGCRWRTWTTRRSCGASWSWAASPRWRGRSGCRRRSPTWCAACSRKTRSTGRRPPCCSIRRAPAVGMSPPGRRGGRSAPCRWLESMCGGRARWPTRSPPTRNRAWRRCSTARSCSGCAGASATACSVPASKT